MSAVTYERIWEELAPRVPTLLELSRRIHGHPELAFAERDASRRCADILAAEGFRVLAPYAGLDTAFRASIGTGELEVGIFAEYDALPEIGHACGHNIIAAAAVGAGVALAGLVDDLGITLHVFGTPAEESGGGKILMHEAGAFAGLGCALMLHPGPDEIVETASYSLADIAVEFSGREAHASASPERGRNAADAVTIAQVAIGLLRQHLLPGQQVHGIVSKGGAAPNIVPGATEALYYLRATDTTALADLEERVGNCFAAGALGTGCTHRVRTVSPTYTNLTTDRGLNQLYRNAIESTGRRPLSRDAAASKPLGSTDMGNISNVIPSIHPMIGLDADGATTHQREFAAAAVSPSADRAVRDGAFALAATAAAAAADPEQRARLIARSRLHG